jgi:peptide/nickel transport system substrate-binding protein
MRSIKYYPFFVLLVFALVCFVTPGFAAPTYKEAPALAKLVSAGSLPPVEKRLPDHPLVSNAPNIGGYGGILTYGAGQLDLPMNPYIPVEFNMMGSWMGSTLTAVSLLDDTKLEPDLAESWAVSKDGLTITFNLRKGVKWSDGEPFTADDILFTYNDIILNPQMTGWYVDTVKSSCTVNGKAVKMTKVNDYVFTVTMTKPDADFVARVFSPGAANMTILPRHEMIKVHPKYASGATTNDWNTSRNPAKKPAVLAPWYPSATVGNKVIWERNPYYWRVDRNGQQLPYIDTFVQWNWDSSSAAALAVISGDLSGDFLGWMADQAEVLKAQEAARPYYVQVFNVLRPQATLIFNLDDADESLRMVFRNTKFKDALSLLFDRTTIAEKTGILFTPLKSIIWPDTAKLSPTVAAKFVVKEDQKLGLKMLDDMGIVDKNGDGWREFPPGTPKAGQPFEFVLMAGIGDTARLKVAEEVKYQLDQLGIKVTLNPQPGETFAQRITEGDFDIVAEWVMGPSGTTMESMLVPNTIDSTGDWVLAKVRSDGRVPPYQPKTAGKDILPWQAQWMSIIQEYAAGKLQKKAAFDKALEVVVPNLPSIPLIAMHFMNVVPDKIGNYPTDIAPNIKANYWPLSQRDNFQLYVFVRWWDWYYRK